MAHPPAHHHRDRALRRLSLVTKGVAAGAVIATGGLAAAIAGATPAQTTTATKAAPAAKAPARTAVKAKIDAAVYGIGPGSFNTPLPTLQTSGTSKYYDLQVNYTQATDLLLLPGPTITVQRSKRVWVAGS